MALTDEQAKKIKEHLFTQLKHFPDDKQTQIKSQIDAMSNEDLEEFLKQNQLDTAEETKCFFCSIIDGKVQTFQIASDKENVAILDINPINDGHVLVIPKKHSETLSENTKEFAESISKKIHKIFSPKTVEIQEKNLQGHAYIEVIPLNSNEKERRKTTPEELKEVQEKFSSYQDEIKKPVENSCTLCSIIDGKIASFAIDKNKNNLAILELNPLSIGHSLIIPFEHINNTQKIPSTTFALAKKISKRITKKYNPQEVKISTALIKNHAVVEVIPIYGNEKERYSASPEQLQEIQKKISKPEKKKTASIKKTKKKSLGLPILKRRIP